MKKKKRTIIYKKLSTIDYIFLDKKNIEEYTMRERTNSICLFLLYYNDVCFREFDNHAAEIIDICYRTEEDFAIEILTTNSKLYFNYSPLELAKQNNSRSFLATKCVQKYLDKQWYGEVNNHGHVAYFIDFLVKDKKIA